MFKQILTACLIVTGCNSNHKVVPVKSEPKQTVQIEPTTIGPTVNRYKLLYPVFRAMIQEEKDALPYDSPRHANGRELDGFLRPLWEKSYLNKVSDYGFENSKYSVKSKTKALLVPQVCADFIIDTIDLSAGTWYSADTKHPERIVGKFDFRKQIADEKLDPRNAGNLIQFFKNHPDDFEMLYDGEADFEVGDTEKFKSWLFDLKVQIGDIVIIRGKAPWDKGKELHWHSFFITRLDGDGKVAMIIGNAGKPDEWLLEKEVNRAPKRKPISVIRLTNHFLERLPEYE